MNRQKKSCKMMGKKTVKSCGFKALRKGQAKLILILVLLSILQEGYLMQSTGDDHICLKNLKQALEGGNGGLSGWPDQFLSTPCYKSSQSNLTGINCNDNRVVSILLNGMSLSGSISSSIANCNQLNALDLSNNTLSGSIPPEIGQLSNLAKLNLSVNHLKGGIPDALANCTYLSIIDLHRNRLTGYIPQNLGTLQRLSVFDVSYNDLSGQVPYSLANTSTGAVRFNISSFKGNKHLYGYPLPDPKVHNLSVLAIVGIGLGSGMLSLIVSFTAVCIWLRVSEQHLAAEEGKISQLMPE